MKETAVLLGWKYHMVREEVGVQLLANSSNSDIQALPEACGKKLNGFTLLPV